MLVYISCKTIGDFAVSNRKLMALPSQFKAVSVLSKSNYLPFFNYSICYRQIHSPAEDAK